MKKGKANKIEGKQSREQKRAVIPTLLKIICSAKSQGEKNSRDKRKGKKTAQVWGK